MTEPSQPATFLDWSEAAPDAHAVMTLVPKPFIHFLENVAGLHRLLPTCCEIRCSGFSALNPWQGIS